MICRKRKAQQLSRILEKNRYICQTERLVPVPVDVGIWDEELAWLYVAVPHEVNLKWSAEVIRDRAKVDMYGRVFAANWEIATTHPR